MTEETVEEKNATTEDLNEERINRSTKGDILSYVVDMRMSSRFSYMLANACKGGLTQEAFGVIAGRSGSTVCGWAQGNVNIKKKNVDLIVERSGVSEDWLLWGYGKWPNNWHGGAPTDVKSLKDMYNVKEEITTKAVPTQDPTLVDVEDEESETPIAQKRILRDQTLADPNIPEKTRSVNIEKRDMDAIGRGRSRPSLGGYVMLPNNEGFFVLKYLIVVKPIHGTDRSNKHLIIGSDILLAEECSVLTSLKPEDVYRLVADSM